MALKPARRYVFGNMLGRGGFGEVYQATWHSPDGDVPVAIKVLRPEFSDDTQASKRLADEAAYLAHIEHKGIVRVHELTVLGGRLSLVTERVQGCNLGSLLKHTGPVPERVAVEIMARVATALNGAYTSTGPDGRLLGLVHRDVKPGNVLISDAGEITLVDFGVARSNEIERNAETGAFNIVASGPYTPPERLLQEAPSAAGDVWSLGVTVAELATGQRLLEGQALQRLGRMVARDKLDEYVAEFLRDLPVSETLRRLLTDAISVDPEARPSSLALARSCARAHKSMEGPTLRQYAKTAGITAPVGLPGALTGTELLSAPLESLNLTFNNPTNADDGPSMGSPDDFEDLPTDAGVDLVDPDTLRRPPPPSPETVETAAPPAEDEPRKRRGALWWFVGLGTLAAATALVLFLGMTSGDDGSTDAPVPTDAAASATSSASKPAVADPKPSRTTPTSPDASPPAGEAGATDQTPPTADNPAPEAAEADGDGNPPSDDASAAGSPQPEVNPDPAPAPAPVAAPAPAPVVAPAPVAAPKPKPKPKPKPPALEPLAAGMGRFTFRSDVPASISIDGTDRGTTPLTVDLKAGGHTFMAEVPGHPDTATGGPFDVAEGKTYEVQLQFSIK